MSNSLKVKPGTVLRRTKPYVRPVPKVIKPTLKQKYEYLLSKMKISDVDLWEQDACVRMESLYFQFERGEAPDQWKIDKAVIAALNSEI